MRRSGPPVAGRRSREGGGPFDPLVLYYLATPLFAGLDAVADWPVRVAALPEGGWRWFWYVVLLLLGLLCRIRPRLTPLVGMTESSVNLTFLLLSILLPIWGLPAGDLDRAGTIAFGPVRIVNVLLSGGALILAFHRSQAALGRELTGRDP